MTARSGDSDAKEFKSLYQVFNDSFFAKKCLVNDEEVTKFLNKISTTLLASDVDIKLIKPFCNDVRENLGTSTSASGAVNNTCFGGKHRVEAMKAQVVKSLQKLLSPKDEFGHPIPRWDPLHACNKLCAKPYAVVAFVGLNGNGKSVSLVKYAHYYKQRGLKPLCIGADTFRAGAFDQLKQYCLQAKVTSYGSYIESDPSIIIENGIQLARKEGYNLILIDTAGRHKQSEELAKEIREIIKVANPDHTVLVMDGLTNGRLAMEHAAFFHKETKGFGSIILTKMDCVAATTTAPTSLSGGKGGCVLAVAAATKAHVIFLGTGESCLSNRSFEPFDSESYIRRLLGFGDMKRILDILSHEAKSNTKGKEEKSEKLMRKMLDKNSKFTFDDFREQLEILSEFDSVDEIMRLFPALSTLGKGNKHNNNAAAIGVSSFEKKIKNCIIIIDSMHSTERHNDADFLKNNESGSRINRLVHGSGRTREEINETMKMFRVIKEGMDNMKKLPRKIQKNIMNKDNNNIGSGDTNSTLDLMKSMLSKKNRGNKAINTQMNNLLKGFKL